MIFFVSTDVNLRNHIVLDIFGNEITNMMLYCFRRSQFTKENIVSYFPDVLMLLNSLDMGPKQHFVGSASFQDHIIKEFTLILVAYYAEKKKWVRTWRAQPLTTAATGKLPNRLTSRSSELTIACLTVVPTLFWFNWAHYKLLNPKNYWMNESICFL